MSKTLLVRGRGGTAALAAALALGVSVMSAQAAGGTVAVYYAASLHALNFGKVGPQFSTATGYGYEDNPENSGLIVNEMKAKTITPDVVEFADASLNGQLMGSAGGNYVKWYAVFAHTHLVVGYCPNSPLADTFRKVAAGKEPWWKALLSKGLKLGRTDPNSDPKGYRTVMMFNLAQKLYYKKIKGFPKNFETRVLGTIYNPDPEGRNSTSSQVFPEATLVSQVSSCNLDAGMFYLPEAKAAGLPYFPLPSQLRFGWKKYDKLYAKEKYTNSEGVTDVGSPIYYTVTIPSTVQNEAGAVAFVKFALSSKAQHDEASIGLQTIAPVFYGDKSSIPPGV